MTDSVAPGGDLADLMHEMPRDGRTLLALVLTDSAALRMKVVVTLSSISDLSVVFSHFASAGTRASRRITITADNTGTRWTLRRMKRPPSAGCIGTSR